MEWTRLSRGALGLAVAVLAGACGQEATPPSTPAPSPSPTPRPNFVVINADDLRASTTEFLLGEVPPAAWFQPRAAVPVPQVYMDTLKRLLDGGAAFRAAYVAAPVCCPSRTSLLTGLFTHTHHVYGNTWPGGGFGRYVALGLDQQAFPGLLQEHGYETAIVGKLLNQFPYGMRADGNPMPGWSRWYVLHGNVYYDFDLDENGRTTTYPREDENYQTRVFARKFREILHHARARERPFFAYLAPTAPHVPSEPAPEHTHLFQEGCQVPRLLSWDEDTRDKPELRFNRPLTADQVRLSDRTYCNFLRATLALDTLLADVLRALEEAGQRENTYVVFTSDNGFFHGEHRIPSGKDMVYDESARVPLVVAGPRVAGGRTLPHVVSHVDIGPTLLEWAGIPVPDSYEGRSLAPVLRRDDPLPPERWRTAVLFERYEQSSGLDEEGVIETAGFAAIRTPRHVYAEYAGGDRELYDMEKDPLQLDNLFFAGGPDAGLVAELRATLVRLQRCRGRACRD